MCFFAFHRYLYYPLVCSLSELPYFLYRIILYTIVLADYDQEKLEVFKDVISTKSGINRLALYHSSIGRSVFGFCPFTFKIYPACAVLNSADCNACILFDSQHENWSEFMTWISRLM